MMDWIIAWSLRNRVFVLAGAVLLLGLGVWTGVEMPVDVFPDLTAPTVTVLTEAHGMAPTEVETLVTFPIEAALNGASGVRRVRSATAVGISVVWVEFEWGQESHAARQVVAEKLALVAGSLPAEVERPVLAPVSSIMGELLFLAVTSDRHDPIEVRTFADATLRRRLLGIPGISQVTPIGGGEKQYQVVLDPAALVRYRVSLEEVERALAETNRNASAGFIVGGGTEHLIEARGRVRSLEDLGSTVVTLRGDRPILVRELGSVRIGEALKRGEASAQGKPAVILGIRKQPGANSIALTKAIEAALDEIERTMPAGIAIDRGIFRQADFIEVSIRNISAALRDGAILVVLIVLLFLAHVRATAITLLAMPLSLAAALLSLKALGGTINTMTLGGFAIAIGALVDDAVIDVENVVRRLRQNALRPAEERRPALAVVYDASREIRGSIVYATLVIALVFLPLFFLSGVEGRLLRPLGFAYVVSLLASLVVALTVTPVLCLLLLPRSKGVAAGHDSRFVGLLKRGYGALLRRLLPHPFALAALSTVLLAAAVFGAARAGRGFLPEFNEGTLTISAVTLPGTSLAESDRLGRLVEQLLLEQPEVTRVARRTGRAELDEHAQGVEAAELDVSLAPGRGRSKEQLLHDLRSAFTMVPGMNIVIGQPISHRIDHMLSGTRASIAVKVFGDDLVKLRRAGEAVKRVMAAVPGVVDLVAESQMEIPFVRVRFDREAIARHGLRVGEVARSLETALVGSAVSRVLEGRNAFDLVVRLPDEVRADLEALGRIPIDSARGGKVPLRTLARIAKEKGPSTISRENVQRKYVVMANVAGRDLRGTVEEIREKVAASGVVPEGHHVEYGGQFESAASAGRTLSILGVAVVLGIFLLLYVALGAVRDAGLVMANLPLALVGGVAGVWLTGGVITIAHVIGFIALFGIATRNGLMLVSHVKHLREVEGETDFRAAVERGSIERLAPILMTALAAGLALVPLALGGGRPGNEIQTPMAIVILSGLLSSTFLNMIVVPTLYLRFGPRGPAGGRSMVARPRAALAGLLGLLLWAPGCARTRDETPITLSWVEEPKTPAPETKPLPSGPLSEAEAEALCLAHHPSLRSAASLEGAARARVVQAGALPNPRLQLSSESNRFDDPFSSGEHLAGVSVPLPWGGRVGAGRRAAEHDRERRSALSDAEAAGALARVREAFASALAGERRADLAREIADAARGTAELARQRATAGDLSEAERLRAEVEEARAAVDAAAAVQDRDRALALLAGAMGLPELEIGAVRGELPVPEALPGIEELASRLERHPKLRAMEAAVQAARAGLDRTRAERVPDLVVGAAYRRIQSVQADAFDLAAGIDLPVFDRRSGAVLEAEHLVRALEADRQAARVALHESLQAAVHDGNRAASRVAGLDRELLPRAERSLAIAERAHEAGATTIADVLLARRALAEARNARVAALLEGALARARLRELVEEP